MADTPQAAHTDWKPGPGDVRGLSVLQVPGHSAVRDDSFLLDPEETKAWISGLPMANIQETARLVFETLSEFNRQAIPDELRVQTAEIFRQPIRYISGNFEKYYIDAAFPLSAKNHKTVALNRELHAELAISYKIFIRDALLGRKRISRRLLALSIHRAIGCLSEILLISSLAHERPPRNTWREIHYLFALAAKNEVHRLPVGDAVERPADNGCIADLYKRILLHALAPLCHLRQRENQSLYHKLLEWTAYARLSTPAALNDHGEQFVAHLSSDHPPHHLSLERNGLTRRCCLLDTRDLVRHLRNLLEAPRRQKDKRPGAAWPPRPLLRHLIRNWSGRPRRKHARTRLHFDLKLAIGIPSVHSLVKARTRKDTAIPAGQRGGPGRSPHAHDSGPPRDWSDFPSTPAGPPGKNANRRSHFPAPSAETTLKDNVHAPWAGAAPRNGIRIFECKTSNESAGGYCIDWEGADVPKIKPGELIGIQSAGNDRQFGIGTTRWIKAAQGQKLQLGMQLLAPHSLAVQTRLDAGDCDNTAGIHDCLLVPEAKAMNTPLSLIAPAHSYREGDIIWISTGSSERRVRLAQALESTPAFTQYQIARHSPHPR